MNKEVKEKWVSALRSGEYKQTKQVLKDEQGFCCLGVLCDIYSKEKNVEWTGYRILLQSTALPHEIMQYAELTECNPCVLNKDTLAGLNDQGKSFIEIADIIEKEL